MRLIVSVLILIGSLTTRAWPASITHSSHIDMSGGWSDYGALAFPQFDDQGGLRTLTGVNLAYSGSVLTQWFAYYQDSGNLNLLEEYGFEFTIAGNTGWDRNAFAIVGYIGLDQPGDSYSSPVYLQSFGGGGPLLEGLPSFVGTGSQILQTWISIWRAEAEYCCVGSSWSASVDVSLTYTYEEVPEPATGPAVAIAVVALAAIRRLHAKKSRG